VGAVSSEAHYFNPGQIPSRNTVFNEIDRKADSAFRSFDSPPSGHQLEWASSDGLRPECRIRRAIRS
jgi:hypothetical protein